MNTLVISYSNHLDEGRLKELINVTKKYGNPTIFISSDEQLNEENLICIKKRKNRNIDFFHFSLKVVQYASVNRDKYDIVLLDFMTAAVSGLIIKYLLKDKFIVQDVRELAFPKNFPKVPGKLLSLAEGKMIKKSNLVIAANEQRAVLMKDYYNIKQPYNFENIRLLGPILKKSDSVRDLNITEKFKIISTGGPSIERGIIKILDGFKKLPSNFELTIVGNASETDHLIVNKYIKDNHIENVKLFKSVDSEKLYDLVRKSHIGIVHYHFNDINNQYCASGKVYEYLGCLLPLATTENPPLKDFCEKHGVGVANNDFAVSLSEIYENYAHFKANVETFSTTIDVNKNNEELADYIVDEYKKWGKVK